MKGPPDSGALGTAPAMARATRSTLTAGLGGTMTRITLEELSDQRVLLERLLTASTALQAHGQDG
jgi:hypothetical protein